MSIPVRPEDLPAAFEEYAVGYLLTVTPEATVRAATVLPRAADGPGGVSVVVGAGRSSAANIATNAAVTLLCPPSVDKGFTLIVDGTAALDGDDLRITPSSAVLHRPPYHHDGPPAPAFGGPPDPALCRPPAERA